MDRIEVVQEYADHILENPYLQKERDVAFIHTYGVVQCCTLLASKRGLNPEFACVCGLLHDLYSYKTGFRIFHGINGAEMTRVAFKHELKDVFTNEEQILIESAIFHHMDKDHVHDEYDEVLKDADILQHWLFDMLINTTKSGYVGKRLIAVQKEFGLSLSQVPVKPTKKMSAGFSRVLLSDIAEKLARRNIHGNRTDNDFMEMIKYYPETSAFDELGCGWCAAFVYHCAVLSGLEIAIRYEPMANTRFASVDAWLKWGEKNGFCFYEKDGFTPSRGDIVIYNKIIPKENKSPNTPWYDHNGVILSVSSETITVAEGNIGNRNISGIIERNRKGNIGCYLRIPDGYEYDGWKYDYKTARIRQRKF